MNGEYWKAQWSGGRLERLERLDSAGRTEERILRPWTVQESCKHLKKSRRQIYRDIKNGRIRPLGKFLGEWLLEPTGQTSKIKTQKTKELSANNIPIRLKTLFWDTDFSKLNPLAHRDYILERILEYGDPGAVRWAREVYGLPEMLRVAANSRRVGPKTRIFWKMIASGVGAESRAA